jgi:hypothetical protein
VENPAENIEGGDAIVAFRPIVAFRDVSKVYPNGTQALRDCRFRSAPVRSTPFAARTVPANPR